MGENSSFLEAWHEGVSTDYQMPVSPKASITQETLLPLERRDHSNQDTEASAVRDEGLSHDSGTVEVRRREVAIEGPRGTGGEEEALAEGGSKMLHRRQKMNLKLLMSLKQ